ncbi:hypothetical protein SLEP1_g45709 [Rubroshorea leprosula]|uniref:DUF632 domain-containing protein n=1 Tax=Rubroshorea leprosula TaxID=152421 RepID=A0AAV5LK02_9ROSI|nr:hypothetical protein SLEP1_g45709 [Rubroshorea leprosula]
MTVTIQLGFLVVNALDPSFSVVVIHFDMGCGGSKSDDLPVVKLCRERKEYIKAASDHRFALAVAHVNYFQSLREVGDAIRRFVDEELVLGDSSSLSDSPVLTLPSDDFKPSSKRKKHKGDGTHDSSSASIEDSSSRHVKLEKEQSDVEDSHLHLSSGSASILGSHSESPSSLGYTHTHFEGEEAAPSEPYGNGYSYPYPPQGNWEYPYPPQGNWEYPYPPPGNSTPHTYYMKKSATPSQSFVYQEPDSYSAYGYSGSTPYPNGGGFSGYPMGSPQGDYGGVQRNSPAAPPPAPPSPPSVSAWDFFNVFDSYDGGGYPGYYPQSRYGYGSSTSSPDSKEVRLREGIPELEDETEPEMLKTFYKQKKKMEEEMNNVNRNRNFGEGTSRAVPVQNGSEESTSSSKYFYFDATSTSNSKGVPSQDSKSPESGHIKFVGSSPDTIASKSPEEEHVKKKGVNFEVEEASVKEVESSKYSSLTTLSVHGTKDLREVVQEIRDEFEIASSYGKEVAVLLEVSRLPYQRRRTGFRVIFSRILYLVAPNILSSHSLPRSSIRLTSRTMKLAKDYHEAYGQDLNTRQGNISATLEKLYAWEKKLYKEVKDEERLRVIYEKKCKQLRMLDNHGAESSKIDAIQASIRKLLTKIDVSIKAVGVISIRIHKLRDEELQPQLTELIHGLTRMWKSLLRCHQKQFQAIMESKLRYLRANTGFQRDSGLKATLELEAELLDWCSRFNNWIATQKAYTESLNEWLMRCLTREQEVTADGVAPFSPSRLGAPPIFVICNDWFQAMDRISEKGVANAMQKFATSLRELWERQDEEQRQKTRAQYLSKDFEKRLRNLRMERERLQNDQDALSERTAASKVPSDSGISPLDDLKVDLDLMRKKLEEERARHKEAVKLVHNAASNSLQAGLIPIFEALGNFSSEALQAHEQVRLQHAATHR